MIRPLAVVPVLGLLAACAGNPAAMSAADMSADVAGQAPGAPAPATYVAMAGASDMFEIQSGQIAAQKAGRQEVRDFARMLVDHHTRTSADLMAAAAQARQPPPPPALPADKARKLASLREAPAATFDELFLREQVTAHQEALALHQAYAANGTEAPLKAAAAKAAPIVQSHLDQARRLAARSGNP